MERNPNDNLDSQNTGQTGGTSGSGGASGTGGYSAGAGGAGGGFGTTGSEYGSTSSGYGATGAGSSAGMTGSAGAQEQGLAERAREKLGAAKEKAQSGLSQAREKAGNLKTSLADKLDAGADRLRQRGPQGGAYAGATGDGGIAVSEERTDQLTSGLASGMHSTAEWLRETDLESMKQGIETQVREHPGRTLLIALGVGYVIGKAFRR